jgi:hypothetical protein
MAGVRSRSIPGCTYNLVFLSARAAHTRSGSSRGVHPGLCRLNVSSHVVGARKTRRVHTCWIHGQRMRDCRGTCGRVCPKLGRLDGEAHPLGEPRVRSRGKVETVPVGCRDRSRHGGGTQLLDPRMHIQILYSGRHAQHIHARTRDMALQARVLAPDSLPLIGAGSEPKLVPARAVLKGGAIRSHEAVPANQT